METRAATRPKTGGERTKDGRSSGRAGGERGWLRRRENHFLGRKGLMVSSKMASSTGLMT